MSAPTSEFGELVDRVYAEFLERYGDAELAGVATAAVLNDLLTQRAAQDADRDDP